MPIAERIQKGFSENSLSLIVKAGTLVLGALLAAIVISRIVYPFDLGHLEAFSWLPATHLLEGKNPYSFAFEPPYSMTPYGIVYYALIGVGVKLFGLQLWWGRFLTVLGFAVCLWSAVKITEKLTENREAVWIVCLVSLALFPAQAWLALMRSDLVGLAFAFASVALVFVAGRGKPFGAARLAFIIFLSVAAIFTKHTFLLPVGIIVLRFWQLAKWRESVVYAVAVAALTLLGMFFLNYTSGGGYWWQHFTHAQVLPFTVEKLTAEIFQMTAAPASLVFIAFLLIFIYRKREFFQLPKGAELTDLLRSPRILIWFYLFLAFTTASLTTGRIGANVNYYLESSLLIAIAGGLIYADFRKQAGQKLALAMIALFTLGGAFQLVRFARGEYFRWQSAAYYREISEKAARFAPAGNTCFSVYVELVARGGCAFYFDDYGEYIGDWSPRLKALFESEVRQGRFAVIIWKTDDFQEKFPNYALVKMSQPVPQRIIPVYLYVRKNELSQ